MIGFTQLEVRNFGVVETADLDLADQGLVLVRGVNRDTDAADSNGSGKTTLFHALSWALFGEVVGIARPAEEIIREGASAAEVRVSFGDGTHEYQVIRRRTPTKSKLVLTTDGQSTTERRQSDTEARIREILGLDWDAFRNTVLYGQGDVRRFADVETSDGDRKAVLKRILRLERIDGALKRVRDELRKMRGDRTEADGKVRTARASLSTQERELGRAEDRREGWDEAHGESVRRLEDQVETLDEEGAEDRKVASQVERLEDLVEKVEERLEELGRLRLVASDAGRELREAQSERRVTRSDVTRASDVVGDRRKELEVLDGRDTCPTCHTPLDGSEAARDHLGAMRARLAEAEADLERAREADAAAALEVGRLEGVEAEARSVVRREGRWSTEAPRVRGLLKDAREAASRVAATDARRSGLVDRLEAKRAEVNPHADTVERLTGEVEEGRTAVRKAEAALTAVEAREPPLRFWEEAFSDRGLPSLALDSVVPFISEAANRYLGYLADGDMSVEVVTQTDLKGGGTKEAIDFRLVIEGHADVRPSGGQRKKLSLAVDLALMDLVATREGARIDLVLLDEVLDGLDAEGKARVVVLLRHLRESRSSIFVISHDAQIAEHFERVVTVTKAGGKSTLVTS